MTRPAPFERRLEETSHLKRGWLLVRIWRRPVILVFASVVWQLCATNATAQLSITVLERNRRSVALPTTDVTRIVGSTRRTPQPITVIPLSLEEGDVLVGNTDSIAVRVRCKDAVTSLSGKFRVRMLPSSSPRECNLYFEGSAGARLSVRAGGPTRVVSGAFTLGTSRTRYEIEIPAKKRRGLLDLLTRGVSPTAKVYEGEAIVNSPGFSGAVKQGEKLVAEGLTAQTIQRIEPEDYRRGAEIYARLDVSQANLANEKEIEAAYLKLLGLHRAVLEKPDDLSAITALGKTQQELAIPASDPGGQPSPPTGAIKVSLKPNEKRIISFLSPVNECKSAVTFQLKLNNASFVRLISQADMAVSPGGKIGWQLEFDATGMTAGTYAGGIELTCFDCANKQCLYAPRLFQVTLNVL